MMKSRISRWTAYIVVFLVAMSTGAAGAPAQTTSPSANKLVFTVGSVYDLVSPNPFKACCSMDYEMLFMNYDMLFNFSQSSLQATSGLAQYPPDKSPDGKTWTFHIQSGVKWADGQPLTAADIAFTYNFIWQNHLSVFRSYLGDPASFTAPNPTTFVWTMKTPSLSPLTPPWIPIVPEHIWSKFQGQDIKTIKEFPNLPAIGSGPFELTQWKPGQYLQFEANKSYWGGSPTVDEVIFKVYDNNEALALALKTGEVDFAEALPPDIFSKVKTYPNVTTNVSNSNYLDNLAFNFQGTANPAWKNPQVRLAISYAIDRQTLVDRVLQGYGSIGDSMVLPSSTQWYWKPTGSEVQGYDPAKAKQLLTQAGYVDTNGDGIREDPNGQPLTITLLTISDVTYSVAEGNLIAGWLKAVGIDATTKTVNTAKAYDLWGAHNFDAYVWGWGGDPDPDFILSIFTHGAAGSTNQCGVWSDGCYNNPAYDAMWTQQHTELDLQKRIADVKKMQQYLYEQNPEIVLLYEKDLQAYRSDRWTGFTTQPQPVGSLLFAFGANSYIHIRPVSGPQAAGQGGVTGTSSSGPSPLIWIIVAVIAILVAGAIFLKRRGKSQEDTE